MIRTAVILSALVLTGCAGGRGNDLPSPPQRDITRDVLPTEIMALLPENLGTALTAADSRIAALSDAQIDQVMSSVLRRIGCEMSGNGDVRRAQYSVLGFSAYRSVQLDVGGFEDWTEGSAAHGTAWDAQKINTGRNLHARAGLSGTDSADFIQGRDGLVLGLKGCGQTTLPSDDDSLAATGDEATQ